MSSNMLSVVRESAAASSWPALLFLSTVVLVTVIALIRADRDDVPKVFELFAGAFGFRKPTTDRPTDSGLDVHNERSDSLPETKRVPEPSNPEEDA